MKVVIIGTGYVGLVSGVCFSAIGHKVVCVDLDKKKVDSINNCKPFFYENGLKSLLTSQVKSGRLSATTNLNEAIKNSDVSMIAVGTPFKNNKIDLTYIKKVSLDLGLALKNTSNFHVICVKSTVPPGTTENMVNKIIEKATDYKLGKDYGLCMNPEFLAEGTAVDDFMNPDRIVIGSNDEKVSKIVKDLYSYFKNTDIILTSPSTAEMIKYASNSFLATVISYTNEISNMCMKIENVDAVEVMKGVIADRRLSPIINNKRIKPGLMSFLHPGPGFGGSCFPKDLKAIVSHGNDLGIDLKILNSVISVNLIQVEIALNKIKESFGSIEGKKIAILGLAFKPGTDDIRESPSILLIKKLLIYKTSITAHDPMAIDNTKLILNHPNLFYERDLSKIINDKDIIILMTSWPDYLSLKSSDDIIKNTFLFDARRFLNKNDFKYYSGIGLNK
jgi:UDPglucose 6-dehydrogenase